MTKVRLHIAYDGTNYVGWQKQTGRKSPTIQGELEEALLQLTGENFKTIGSGRTDSGVHARHQVVHFTFNEPDKYPWVKALNSLTGEQILVKAAYAAPSEFHALASARKKTYSYYIQNSSLRPLFRRQYCWWQRRPLDLQWLQAAAKLVQGKQDFKSFQSQGTPVPDTVREVFSAKWYLHPGELLEFRITGEGFLKQMVRNLVGTQIQLHLKGAKPSTLIDILKAKSRQAAGLTAPAHGLFLNSVEYPPELDNQCRKL